MNETPFRDVIDVAGRKIGQDQSCFVVAEIGINHNGDLALARKEIDAAAIAGADAVKFQNYRTEDFLSDHTLKFTYKSQGKTVTEAQYEMFKRCELSAEDLRALKQHCDERGIEFQSTPTSEQGVRELVELGVHTLKNGSDFLCHTQLVTAMGQTGLLTILSTGMATASEISESVQAFRETGNDKLILLHCVSNYPASAEALNLAKIPALGDAFHCPVGFSDHSEGTTAAVAAVALGACWLEKHFTLDRNLPGPDHWFSSDPAEFAQLVRSIRFVESARGSPRLVPSETETGMRDLARLSCAAARRLGAGTVLRSEDIVYRRPGTGLPPRYSARLVGHCVSNDMTEGEIFGFDQLTGNDREQNRSGSK